MKAKPIYQHIASALCAFHNCKRSGSLEWQDNHESTINQLCKDFMPSGSGVDCGTEFDWDASSTERQLKDSIPARLVFSFSYHHMNENGMYEGWTSHKATVKPCLVFGYKLAISGPDKNGIKDYLYDLFSHALDTELAHTENGFKEIDS